ncbi:hypothetical protein [Lysobacter hankyongensis]|uniref:Uncharacterized protein n=1 Tax=Lysobacter hankyongensis TaxID=1176535 RepID=A0ABP9CCW2_9GAMM
MPANAAIYLPHDGVDLSTLFRDAKSDKTLFRKPTYFDVALDGDIVRFNVMEPSRVEAHLRGFLGYIDSLDQDAARKRDTANAIAHTRTVLGLITERDFEQNPAIWQSLFRIADAYDGFVFVHESVLLANGAVLVGPLLDLDP